MIGCDHRRCALESEVIKGEKPYVKLEPNVDTKWSRKLKECSFALEYLIAALISRGAVVKDQILVCH